SLAGRPHPGSLMRVPATLGTTPMGRAAASYERRCSVRPRGLSFPACRLPSLGGDARQGTRTRRSVGSFAGALYWLSLRNGHRMQDNYDELAPGVWTWLQAWYATQCNGEWEHGYGLEIETIDNPGWSVKIDLNGTSLTDRHYERQAIHRSEHDW